MSKSGIRIVIAGAHNVGKSSLMLRYTENFFSEETLPTIGCDFRSVSADVGEPEPVKVKFWDTGGKGRFRPNLMSFFGFADGIILMYDVTNKDSFELISLLLKDYQAANGGCVVMLLGNKQDMDYLRDIERSIAEDLAEEHDLMFTEVSVRKGADEVKKVVNTFIRAVVEGETIPLEESQKQKRSGSVSKYKI